MKTSDPLQDREIEEYIDPFLYILEYEAEKWGKAYDEALIDSLRAHKEK